LTRLGDQPMPLSAVLGCARLAELDRKIGQPERANHWLDLAARSCPNHPDLLAARGRLALAAGDFATARRSFDRARVFGCNAPDVLAWLAEHALVTRSEPLLAKTLATRAISRAAELPVPEQARVHELAAKVAFVLAATESAKDSWIQVAKLRGE